MIEKSQQLKLTNFLSSFYLKSAKLSPNSEYYLDVLNESLQSLLNFTPLKLGAI